MRRLILPPLIGLLGLLLAAMPAAAQSLDSLRAEGAIAERFDGFTETRPGAPGAARGVVDRVNADRRQIYAQRASEQGVPASEVGKIFAPKIFEKAPAGTYFRRENGSYVRK
ncbi:MAG: YdbL family protein [Pseudomonadota bacterium]